MTNDYELDRAKKMMEEGFLKVTVMKRCGHCGKEPNKKEVLKELRNIFPKCCYACYEPLKIRIELMHGPSWEKLNASSGWRISRKEFMDSVELQFHTNGEGGYSSARLHSKCAKEIMKSLRIKAERRKK